jgi:hypothetical protein
MRAETDKSMNRRIEDSKYIYFFIWLELKHLVQEKENKAAFK